MIKSNLKAVLEDLTEVAVTSSRNKEWVQFQNSASIRMESTARQGANWAKFDFDHPENGGKAKVLFEDIGFKADLKANTQQGGVVLFVKWSQPN